MRYRSIIPVSIEQLGFCCPYAFFRCYSDNSAIAARLGVSSRAIRYWRERYRNEELECERVEECQLSRIKKVNR